MILDVVFKFLMILVLFLLFYVGGGLNFSGLFLNLVVVVIMWGLCGGVSCREVDFGHNDCCGDGFGGCEGCWWR